MVRTGTRFPEEVDGAKVAPAAVAVAISVTVAETTRSKNINLKEKERQSNLQIINYRNWTQTHSIQEDY